MIKVRSYEGVLLLVFCLRFIYLVETADLYYNSEYFVLLRNFVESALIGASKCKRTQLSN